MAERAPRHRDPTLLPRGVLRPQLVQPRDLHYSTFYSNHPSRNLGDITRIRHPKEPQLPAVTKEPPTTASSTTALGFLGRDFRGAFSDRARLSVPIILLPNTARIIDRHHPATPASSRHLTLTTTPVSWLASQDIPGASGFIAPRDVPSVERERNVGSQPHALQHPRNLTTHRSRLQR